MLNTIKLTGANKCNATCPYDIVYNIIVYNLQLRFIKIVVV